MVKTDQPLVSIIIVNWNGMKWLKDCLGSLAKQTYHKIEIVFIDNASTDGSVAWIRKEYPKVKIIINRENLGFSHSNNIGYHAARGEYILFLNNDTVSHPDMVAELIKVFRKDRTVGGAQGKILLMDDHTLLDTIGAFLTPTGFLFHNRFRKKDSPDYDRQINLYTAKGACMMYRADVLRQVEVEGEIFDPSYFAYFEETDLCHRVWLAGYRIVYGYQSLIYHKMGATSSNLENTFVQYHSFKNRISSYLKNLGTVQLIRILPVHLCLCILIAYLKLAGGNVRYFLAIHRSILWNIQNIRHTRKLRQHIQSVIRKKADRDLMPAILRHPGLRYYLIASGQI